MNKFAVIFVITSWEELDLIFNYSQISKDPEDYDLCIARQLCLEIKCCQEFDFPYYYLVHAGDFKGLAPCKEHGQIWEYKYQLYTSSKKAINKLCGAQVLIRSNCFEMAAPLKYLTNSSAKNILTWEDELKVRKWYHFVSEKFTKRKIKEINVKDITQGLLEQYADNRDKIFIKTKNKDVSFVTDTAISHFEPRRAIENMASEHPLIISEPLGLLSDKSGALEYRIWITGNKISSISRYLDYLIDYEIPQEIETFAKEFAQEYREVFPICYVLDLGIDYSKGVVVIELNPLPSAGRYAQNNFGKFLQDLSNFL